MGSHEARAALDVALHLNDLADHGIEVDLVDSTHEPYPFAVARFPTKDPAALAVYSKSPAKLAAALLDAGVALFDKIDAADPDAAAVERRSAIQDEADGVPDVGGMLSEAVRDGENPASVAGTT